jgi:hypothetical protein
VARRRGGWVLESGVPVAPADVASMTSLPEDIAWRVFTKRISAVEAQSRVTIEGDVQLGAVVLRALAIVG